MSSIRRHPHRRRSFTYGSAVITIRIGSRRSPRRFHEVQVTGPKDAGRFDRIIEDQVHAYPRDPLIISVNGYQPWLEDIFDQSFYQDHWSDISDLDKQTQFSGTMQFPEKASQKAQIVPWTFIMDQMNVPQVYYWSAGMEPPRYDDVGLPDIDNFRFRVGVWHYGRGGCRIDRNISVTIIFTRPTQLSDHVVTRHLFNYLYTDEDFDQPREDEEGIVWIFLRLYWLLSDWQNIILAIVARLDEAEENSHGRKLPVKLRTRLLHNEVDRIFEMKEYLHFHTRAFKKLQKLKDDVPKNEQSDPLWSDLDDTVEDLEQYDSTTDGLKERFNNLIELEFNLSNASQAEAATFLGIIATIFLPISYTASLFGMTTVTWPVIWYVWVTIPVLVVCIILVLTFKKTTKQVQKLLFPVESIQIHLEPRQFTLLGDEMPGSADSPEGIKSAASGRKKSKRPAGMDDPIRNQARSRSRARGEKDDD
jgi:Mg2+ and Co2+ transporter CorA